MKRTNPSYHKKSKYSKFNEYTFSFKIEKSSPAIEKKKTKKKNSHQNTFPQDIPESDVSIDFGAIMERMRKLRASISPNDSAKRFEELGVDVFIGEAKFLSKHSISVNGQTLKFSKACIATGAKAGKKYTFFRNILIL